MKQTEFAEPLTLVLDIPVTRRLKLHAIVDANSEPVFHSKRVSDAFTWFLDNEIGSFGMVDDHVTFHVSLQRNLSPAPQTKDPSHG